MPQVLKAKLLEKYQFPAPFQHSILALADGSAASHGFADGRLQVGHFSGGTLTGRAAPEFVPAAEVPSIRDHFASGEANTAHALSLIPSWQGFGASFAAGGEVGLLFNHALLLFTPQSGSVRMLPIKNPTLPTDKTRASPPWCVTSSAAGVAEVLLCDPDWHHSARSWARLSWDGREASWEAPPQPLPYAEEGALGPRAPDQQDPQAIRGTGEAVSWHVVGPRTNYARYDMQWCFLGRAAVKNGEAASPSFVPVEKGYGFFGGDGKTFWVFALEGKKRLILHDLSGNALAEVGLTPGLVGGTGAPGQQAFNRRSVWGEHLWIMTRSNGNAVRIHLPLPHEAH